jgi:hypothetical protein
MSDMIFHTLADDAAVAGARSRFRSLLDELAWRAVERDCDPGEHTGPSVLRRALTLPAWARITRGSEFARMAALYLRSPNHQVVGRVTLPGEQHDPASSVLNVHTNTVLAAYGDHVALAVRLATQHPDCMLIEAADRAWLADLIDTGRRTPTPAEAAHASGNLPLFSDPGWGGVIELLRADDKDPVVMEHSDGDRFPSQIWAGEPGQDRGEARHWWKNAHAQHRWEASEKGLRGHATQFGLPLFLNPDTLHRPAFSPDPELTWPAVAEAWRADPCDPSERTRP